MEGEVEFRINPEKSGKGDEGTGWAQVGVSRCMCSLNFWSHASKWLDAGKDTYYREKADGKGFGFPTHG